MVPEKLNIQYPNYIVSTSRYYSTELNQVHIQACAWMSTAASLTIAKQREQPEGPPTDRWDKREAADPCGGYWTPTGGNGALTRAVRCMSLVNATRRESNQTQKVTRRIPFRWKDERKPACRERKWTSGLQGWERGCGEKWPSPLARPTSNIYKRWANKGKR